MGEGVQGALAEVSVTRQSAVSVGRGWPQAEPLIAAKAGAGCSNRLHQQSGKACQLFRAVPKMNWTATRLGVVGSVLREAVEAAGQW
jgi:hypothetical protein